MNYELQDAFPDPVPASMYDFAQREGVEAEWWQVEPAP